VHPNAYLLLRLFEIHPRGLNGFNEAGQAPHAYKNIDVVIDDLVEAGLATVIATFRPAHKRKYWYFTLACYAETEELSIDTNRIVYQTMKSPKKGGQHVNTTCSGVRACYEPLGIEAVSYDERSQHRNRQIAKARLMA